MRKAMKRSMSLLLVLGLVLSLLPLAAPVAQATAMTIADARAAAAGTAATLTGVVTMRDTQTATGTGTAENTRGDSVLIQDATGGITVRLPQRVINNYSSNNNGATFLSQNIQIGDQITVTGVIANTQNGGLIQLQGSGSGIAGLATLDAKVPGTFPPSPPSLATSALQSGGGARESQYVSLSGEFKVSRVVEGSQSGVNVELTQGTATVRAKFLDTNGNVLTGSALPIEGEVFRITGGAVSRGGAVSGIGLALGDFVLFVTPDARTYLRTELAPVTGIPAPGSILSGTPVTLACTSSGVKIFYTIDGSDPKTSGTATEFASPSSIMISSATTIKAVSERGGLYSDVSDLVYTVDAPAKISIAAANAAEINTQVTIEGIVTNTYNATQLFIQDGPGSNDAILVHVANAAAYVGREVRVIGYRTANFGINQITLNTTTPATSQIPSLLTLNPTPTPVTPTPVYLDEVAPPGRGYGSMLVSLGKVQITERNAATTINNHFIGDGTHTGQQSNVQLRMALPASFNNGDWITIPSANVYWFSPNVQLFNAVPVLTTAPLVTEVSANPVTGADIPMGTNITLSCSTSGATIYYTVNGGALQSAPAPSVNVPITAFNQSGNTAVITAYAEYSAETSRVRTYTYTQSKLTGVSAERNYNGTMVTLFASYGATIKYDITKNVGNAGGTETVMLNQTYDPAVGIVLTSSDYPLKIETWSEQTNYINSDRVVFNYDAPIVGGESIYFGQLHSHTNQSDGIGTLAQAYTYARDTAGLDFFAVTDHSNFFEAASSTDPRTMNLIGPSANGINAPAWVSQVEAAASAFRPGEFISFPGFEMTWSGGPGHINTFFTDGFASRNNSVLNGKPFSGMRAYYELLERAPGSVSMFNHPGDTFGNFNNFAYYNPLIGQRITLIEVGNGEGAIGGGGYFPSYEQYTLALDKGWYVAPVNSQDNHQGRWGNSNSARTAIWTNDLSLNGVQEALQLRRVYSTEVADLQIVYKVNGIPLGSVIDVVPGEAVFTAEITNPTATNYVKSVHIVTNGGRELGPANPGTRNYNYSHTIDSPDSGYYYLWIVIGTPQGDRIAVTAPVWLGKAKVAGFNTVERSAVMPVTTEALTITAELFNGEGIAATLDSIRFDLKDDNGVIINLGAPTDANGMSIAAFGELRKTVSYTPSAPGDYTVTVTAVISFTDGEIKTYMFSIDYEVRAIEDLIFLGVDGSHFNEYAAPSGVSYANNMTNLSAVAANYGIRVVTLTSEAALIDALGNPQYGAFLFTSPNRRVQSVATARDYSPATLAAIKSFSERGGTLIVSGWNNIYEGPDGQASMAAMPFERLMSSQQNQLLANIGSTLRIARDGAADRNDSAPTSTAAPGAGSNAYWPTAANPPHRLFPTGRSDHNGYDMGHWLLAGVDPIQQYSQYGGTTLYAVSPANAGNWQAAAATTLPNTVSRAVSLPPGARSLYRGDPAHNDTTGYPWIRSVEYSKANSPTATNQYMILATETLTHANGVSSQLIVSGGAFMSNFETITPTPDNIADIYSNQNIVINILKSIEKEPIITPIPDIKTLPIGTRVTVQGTVTSATFAAGDNNKGFFDTVYIQDANGNGVSLHPVSSGVQVGQLIRASGRVGEYQGEKQVGTVSRVEVRNSAINPVIPAGVTTAASMLPANTGKLITVIGEVSDIVFNQGVLVQFTIDDGSGPALVYINAYITSAVNLSGIVAEGNTISVTGLASIGEAAEGVIGVPRIRVRDRNEIRFPSTDAGSPGGSITGPTEIPINIFGDGGSDEAVRIPATMDTATGEVTAHINEETLDNLIEEALHVADEDGTDPAITFNLSGVNGAKSLTLDLDVIEALNDADVSIVVLLPDGEIILTPEALEMLVEEAEAEGLEGGAPVTIEVVITEEEELTPLQEAQTKGFENVFSIDVFLNGRKVDLPLIVSLPYELKEGEDPNAVCVWYLNSEGMLTRLDATYNPETGMIRFTINHQSYFVVGYYPAALWVNTFRDVIAKAWYYDAVEYANYYDLLEGYGDGRFGTGDLMTRAMLVRALWNMEGMPAPAGGTPFADVPESTWYSQAVAWAYENGIAEGLENGLFAPSRPITRQEAAVMMHRYATGYKGYDIQIFRGASSFTDAGQIGGFAQEAVTAFSRAGVLNGSNNMIMPRNNMTREQYAQILMNFIRLVVEQ